MFTAALITKAKLGIRYPTTNECIKKTLHSMGMLLSYKEK
jgi:hypothetical protein